MIILRFKLPANERLQYRAGQYIEFLLKDGKRRSFSMANAPHDDALIELHIRHLPGGLFTDRLFGVSEPALKVRDILRFEGAHGGFYLRDDSDKPIIPLASGTGFAPIKAIIEHMIHTGNQRPVTLFWGGRRPKDLYLNELAEGWASQRPGQFRYVPVVSDALPDDGWTGRTGFVHRAVMADFPDYHGIRSTPVAHRWWLSQRAPSSPHRGLPDADFFADNFTVAGAIGS